MKEAHRTDDHGGYFDDDLFETISNMNETELEFYQRFEEKIRIRKPDMTLREVLTAYYGLMLHIANILDKKGDYTPSDPNRGRFFMRRAHRLDGKCIISDVSVIYEYPCEEYRNPQRVVFGSNTTIVNCVHQIESEGY